MFVINSLGAGGTERSTALLLPRMHEHGIEPIVVCLFHRDEGDERAVIEAGFDVRFLQAQSLPGRVRELRTLLRQLHPAVIHTAIFEADVVGRLAAIRSGIPVVSSLVNTPYVRERLEDPNVKAWKLAIVREVDRWSGKFAHAHYHAVTQGVADDAVATLHIRPDRVSVVERGRDPELLGRHSPDRRAKARLQFDLEPADFLVLAVGRQEFQKGHVRLIEAAQILARKRDRPRLIVAIAGRSGNATRALEDAVRNSGISDRVRMLGHRDDVAELLAASDAFVMPSLYEGTAGAAIEALALETPIVASRLSGVVGVLVDGENARLVPVGDASALARAIEEVIDDPAAARSRTSQGRAIFDERFTLDRSAKRMAELYDSLALMRPRP